MLFTHFYLTHGPKLGTWFVSPAINFSINKLTKKVFTGAINCYICFSIGEDIASIAILISKILIFENES